MHEVLVNRLHVGGLSLPRKSVVRLTDRPDMTLDVYRGRKTTMQQQQQFSLDMFTANQDLQPEQEGSSVADNMLDYQSRDHKIDPPLLRSSR